MSSIGNKQVMAQNLKFYVEKSGKSQKELAEVVGVAPSTFNEWVKGKVYPRIDKIEILAELFGVLKSDLIEDQTEIKKKNDAMADIILRMRTDDAFLDLAKKLYNLDGSKLDGANEILTAFVKQFQNQIK